MAYITPFPTSREKSIWQSENCDKCRFITECRLAVAVENQVQITLNYGISIGLRSNGFSLQERCNLFESENFNSNNKNVTL
jgi:hypothetical protein